MNNFFNPFYRPISPYHNSYHYKSNFSNNPNVIEEQESIKKLEPRKSSQNSEHPILNILGIKLYSDDILILLLIFFLYKENINDKLLYIALFSLLFY